MGTVLPQRKPEMKTMDEKDCAAEFERLGKYLQKCLKLPSVPTPKKCVDLVIEFFTAVKNAGFGQ